MATEQTRPVSSDSTPVPEHPGGLTAARPRLYMVLVLVAMLGVGGYHLRGDGLFSCQASGYAPNRYLAYCQAAGYGDYDHGAFWFDLEPGAVDAATNAEVLFLGNSRMQHGFSSPATAAWFSNLTARYFLLGFSHYVNVAFEAPLLQKLSPRARVFVVNADRFFETGRSPLATQVMQDSAARTHYQDKRLWQPLHRALCASVTVLCGHEYVIFRSRATGAWNMDGGQIKNVQVSYDGVAESPDSLEARIAAARRFLSSLPVARECVILTLVPYVQTDVGTSRAVAAALGYTLVAPQPEGLNTFDGGHLDRPSADRWSQAFFEAAGPRIRQCLAARNDTTVKGTAPPDVHSH